jgi:predicted transcriptional regulator
MRRLNDHDHGDGEGDRDQFAADESTIRPTSNSNIAISGLSFENTAETFVELASEQRLSILFKLATKGANLSGLSKELNITMQEVHRNLNRLMETGLIKKDSQGTFTLTTFGNTILKQIPTYDFLSRNKEYFSEHTLGDIPMKFIQRIGALTNSEYIPGMVAAIELWKELYNNSTKYIYGMLPQIPLDLIETIIPKIKDGGVKFSYILPQKAVVPRKRTDLLKNAGFQDLLKKGSVERRMVDRVPVGVVLNEKQATLMFPTFKGDTADMNSMFYSKDDLLFHEWCLDYFRYCWYGSKSFDESKLQEV